ncbi:uncharacterized protein isoform X2 [Musca autumnalis]|uniref:uncharacterized protein isoform X2 n=1 Tax=Musca autumnalis TaxID=221902 RepID=UPI003CF38092
MVFRKVLNVFCLIYIIPLNHARLYQFFFENENLFDKCSDIPGNNGIHDMFDLTELNIEYSDGNVYLSGGSTNDWDVQPEDRIESRCEVFKYQSGSWQPTVYNLLSNDFCQDQYKEGSIWYQAWSKHIPTEERLCVNHKGLTYHCIPYSVNLIYDVPLMPEGRHKLVFAFTAYENGIAERPNSICFKIIGEFLKI